MMTISDDSFVHQHHHHQLDDQDWNVIDPPYFVMATKITHTQIVSNIVTLHLEDDK
jgi:hypothetical protein